jgi:anti-anti-sigma factor
LQRFIRPSVVACGPLPFRCDVQRHRGTADVVLNGELDLATSPVVEQELEWLREARLRNVVLDLRDVTFMDVAGLRLILRWSAAARRDWTRFAVVPGPSHVQRLFEMTATEKQVQFTGASVLRNRSSIPPPRHLRGLNRFVRS